MLLELIIGGAVAGATYALAKKKKASNKQAALAAAATGTGTAGAAWAALAILGLVWPVAIVGVPIAAGYWWMKSRDAKQVAGSDRKMLGPER
jgi:4-hydroxybenzoate polyprenyltransferase